MSSTGSVTRHIPRMIEGDSLAIGELLNRYIDRLRKLARKNLKGAPLRAADDEDVALHAFDSFCRAAKEGGFDKLDDRNDLWSLLVTITIRKAANQKKYDKAGIRDSDRVTAQCDMRGDGSLSGDSLFSQQLLSREPDPRVVAEVSDLCQHLLQELEEEKPTWRKIAELKIDGQTNEQIAKELGKAPKTIEHNLTIIRKKLLSMVESRNE